MRFLQLLLWTLSLPGLLLAQEQSDRGWKFSGQLTGVWTSGNAESSTFGLVATLRRVDEHGELKLESGGIRTDASRTTRRAIGTPDDFFIEENESRETTAENYFARLRYDRKLGEQLVVFAGADVLRNTFAGIDSRTLIATGAGHVWVDNENVRFKTNYGVTYTFQQDVVTNPFFKSNFPGTRLALDLRRKLTGTAAWESALVSDLNFSDTDDVRLDFTNAMPVSVSSTISLKPSLQLIWRNQPALREMDLFAPDGVATGEKVARPLEKLDSFFTLALVVTV
jgi:hypothetical protein